MDDKISLQMLSLLEEIHIDLQLLNHHYEISEIIVKPKKSVIARIFGAGVKETTRKYRYKNG